MTTTVWTPYATAKINGSTVSGVRKARVVRSLTDPVGKAYVTFDPLPSWTDGDKITVSLGGGQHNVLRFTGYLYESDALNAGPSFELVARGPLYKAQKYRNNNPNGLTLQDLTGGPATDQVIARAVLAIAGVTLRDPSDVGGTSILRGTLAPSAYTWRFGETALGYLQRLSQASLGFQMLDDIDGDPLRVQVYGPPQSTSSHTLTEGVDIFEGAHVQRETFSRYTAVTVTGFNFGTGVGAISFNSPDPTPAGVDPFPYSSDMIERTLDADSGTGVSAEAVAAYGLAEMNRAFIRVSSVATPRDDVFAPGQTHTIHSPNFLGLSHEKLRLFTVTAEADDNWFLHTLDYIGGGTSSGGYTGP